MYIAIGNSIGASSRVNRGGGGGFTNTYSLAFDGVDDFVNAGSSIPNLETGDISFSAWVYPTSFSSYNYFLDSGAITTKKGIFAGLQITTGFVALLRKTGVTNTRCSTGWIDCGLTINNWYNIVGVFDEDGGTAGVGQLKLYVNGVLKATVDGSGQDTGTGYDLHIGKDEGGFSHFVGNIDEVSLYNSPLTSENVTSIYNSGAPNDLTSLNPTAWYRNGDNGSYKSPQWLIPNNSNKDKVSNYSLQFDGVDDEILTSSNFVATGEFTISLWMKPTIFNSNQNILGFGTSGSNWINPSAATNIRVRTSSALLNFPETGGNNLVLNAWNHILIYRDSSNNIGVFVNGATFGATSNNTGSLSLSTIGRGATKRFAGNLDEIAFWNTNKSSDISSIYSGGTPTDLSTLSPVAYYKMGEEATFVYNVNPEGTWTIPDQAGSSDGTSNNTFLDTGRVGDAPNSTSNAVSFNMTESDRETDVPS